MSGRETLQMILEAVAAGYISPTQAQEKLKAIAYEPVEHFAKIDQHRQARTGFPEVIWGQDKTPEQIIKIMDRMRGVQRVIMATRISPPIYEQIQRRLPAVQYYEMARICALGTPEPRPPQQGEITLLTAGTADLPVAEEAAITAELMGFPVQRLWDVGVSGIQRLLSNRQMLDNADVLIVVAGMEGALPSVVGGLVNCPVVAVPTSVGYGASFGGIAALLSMLNSCAAGIGVVNIDNGFGAAILAAQILRTGEKLSQR
ncbi:nickel pincer cofactor biosynthesis protein LarB [Spirulina sp. CS-785/01]|uniref:nickel pincer cofactor biosynthesis protein LarB n=1 Tax=Spirulina sp. CS-785/01 TaxID=3021716 RepID=UPI00232BA990|nr:nickel pincer cofactor biosynthesis protein LarB [Spirulina sp. CS-785/01]MDB9313178.1 nickel pincer cofactor biosynthesis protein LarB [Spirulina sp. CS-785/01]